MLETLASHLTIQHCHYGKTKRNLAHYSYFFSPKIGQVARLALCENHFLSFLTKKGTFLKVLSCCCFSSDDPFVTLWCVDDWILFIMFSIFQLSAFTWALNAEKSLNSLVGISWRNEDLWKWRWETSVIIASLSDNLLSVCLFAYWLVLLYSIINQAVHLTSRARGVS